MLWNIVVMEEYYVKECSSFQCELYIFSVDSFYKNPQFEPWEVHLMQTLKALHTVGRGRWVCRCAGVSDSFTYMVVTGLQCCHSAMSSWGHPSQWGFIACKSFICVCLKANMKKLPLIFCLRNFCKIKEKLVKNKVLYRKLMILWLNTFVEWTFSCFPVSWSNSQSQ